MTRIDTNRWKEFAVNDLFVTEKTGNKVQVPTGAWLATNQLQAGDIPRVTVSGVNNGISGHYAYLSNDNYRLYENFISVSFLGTVFYQIGKASLDMKVHCLKPLGIELNIYTACYLVATIKASLAHIAYSDQLSSTVLAMLKLRLPVTADGSPDWEYMETYMQQVFQTAEEHLKILQEVI